jgi:glyoxylase-like metal-dependent hydrolase (beta-lactamase superfamily II)
MLHDSDYRWVFTGDTLINNLLTPTVDPVSPDELAGAYWWMRQIFHDDTIIYPGHGKPSLFGVEWRYNPTVREVLA